jgi:integrase
MKGVYVRENSPFYWIRFYDKFASEERLKRRSINTKIPITEADKKRFAVKEKPIGNSRLREFVKAFRTGFATRNVELESGVRLHRELILSEGYAEFKEIRSIPGSKKFTKKKTLINYDIAVNHMIAACGDKKIYKYSAEKDYNNLLKYFDELKLVHKTIKKEDGSKEIIYKKMSQNSKSNYTRSLRSLWNYFCDKNYAAMNIIEPVEMEGADPQPIPLDELWSILKYLQTNQTSPHHYWLIYFMFLTGCRPSSAMVQLKEDLDFKRKILRIRNVKSGKKKKKEFYQFPMYLELEKLLQLMKPQGNGRLFEMFKLNEINYTYPLTFWERTIKELKNAGKISEYYTLKQIRSTTASYFINIMRMDIFTVKKLLDHSDIKVTDQHYIKFNVAKIRETLMDISLNDLIDETKQ